MERRRFTARHTPGPGVQEQLGVLARVTGFGTGLLGACRSAVWKGHVGVSGERAREGCAGSGGGRWVGGHGAPRVGYWRLGDCCAGRKLPRNFTEGLFSSPFSSKQLVDLHHKADRGCLLSELRGEKKIISTTRVAMG